MGLFRAFNDLNQRVEFETEALSSIYNLSRVDLRKLPIEEQGRLTDEVLEYIKNEKEILNKYNFTVMYFFFASRQMNKQDVKRAVLLACGEYIIQNKSFISSELGNAVLQFVSSET